MYPSQMSLYSIQTQLYLYLMLRCSPWPVPQHSRAVTPSIDQIVRLYCVAFQNLLIWLSHNCHLVSLHALQGVVEWAQEIKMRPECKSLLNIFVLGLGFMLMFTAFQTCGNIEVRHKSFKKYNFFLLFIRNVVPLSRFVFVLFTMLLFH